MNSKYIFLCIDSKKNLIVFFFDDAIYIFYITIIYDLNIALENIIDLRLIKYDF